MKNVNFPQGIGIIMAIFAAGILLANKFIGIQADMTLMAIQIILYFGVAVTMPPQFPKFVKIIVWSLFVIMPLWAFNMMLLMPKAVPQELLQSTLIGRCWPQLGMGILLFFMYRKRS